jgi:hypothetical protein
MKVNRLGLTSTELKYRCYHLWHEREQPNQMWYQRTLKILNDCSNMDQDKFQRYISNSLQKIAMLNKYNN